MGFLDQVKDLVAAARRELVKSGVLDQFQPNANTPGMVEPRDTGREPDGDDPSSGPERR